MSISPYFVFVLAHSAIIFFPSAGWADVVAATAMSNSSEADAMAAAKNAAISAAHFAASPWGADVQNVVVDGCSQSDTWWTCAATAYYEKKENILDD
ncbi:hypothetical protein [Paracoccus sp. PAMC 22219]|uniref:hypothetical protein n=1 Tax=Paracoccus sp. PAMC 22219 TaxID=1569209 RepID=UPI0012E0925B|nr:hypothetical protein [Paracoccus sp. PAMC 22219]